VIANPVAAGLVSSPEEWPGLISTSFEQKWEVKRPEYYFGKASELPEVATLEMSRPPILEDVSSEKIQGMIDDAVRNKVEMKKRQMREKGEEFAGVDAILNTPSSKKATSEEPLGATIPRVGAKNKTLRIKLIKIAREWVRSYREALKSWIGGLRETVFPAGTFAMQRQFQVTVCPPLLR